MLPIGNASNLLGAIQHAIGMHSLLRYLGGGFITLFFLNPYSGKMVYSNYFFRWVETTT